MSPPFEYWVGAVEQQESRAPALPRRNHSAVAPCSANAPSKTNRPKYSHHVSPPQDYMFTPITPTSPTGPQMLDISAEMKSPGLSIAPSSKVPYRDSPYFYPVPYPKNSGGDSVTAGSSSSRKCVLKPHVENGCW